MPKKMFILSMVFVLFSFSASAQDYNALSKLSRGLANITLGAFEIPRQMIKVNQEKGPISGDIAGLFWGPLKGLCFFVGRTVIGAYEVATFVAPSYEPIVEPEFVFATGEEE